MSAFATINTYIGTDTFDEAQPGICGKTFADFNESTNQAVVGEVDEDGWDVNQFEENGFD